MTTQTKFAGLCLFAAEERGEENKLKALKHRIESGDDFTIMALAL